MTNAVTSQQYQERLIPGPGLFIALLLVIPGVALVLTPIDAPLAFPVAIALYLVLAATFLLLSPTIKLINGTLSAGPAQMPVQQLGAVELLGADELRAAIGPRLDARSYLLIRGWIHRGVRIENIDPSDPAPYWILTTRRPQKLADAIAAAQSSTV